MPRIRNPKDETTSPIALKAKARAIVACGNLGGIGKSSYVINLADVHALAERPLDLMQLDEQTKLARMTGQPVTTIDAAVFQKSREDGWAIQRALSPFYDGIVAMPQTGRSLVMEIAGGMSALAHDALRLIDVAEEVEELELSVDAHIVLVASEESVRQAVLEANRHRETFGGNLVFVLNNRYGNVVRFLQDVSDDLGPPVLRLLGEHPTITMRRVLPESMKLWEKLNVRPSQIAHWRVTGGYARVCAETSLDRLEAKLFAGEIVGWAADIREQLLRVYPDLGAADV